MFNIYFLKGKPLDFLDYANSTACIEAGQGFNLVLVSSEECIHLNYDNINPAIGIDIEFINADTDEGGSPACLPCPG